MKARRLIAPVLLLVVALACTDRNPTSAPAVPAPDASLIGGLLGATGLLKCSNLPYASATKTIGPLGGTISAGPHTLIIPPGAVLNPTTITMTAPTGLGVNAVKFQPEGLRFVTPASLTMSYSNCSLLSRSAACSASCCRSASRIRMKISTSSRICCRSTTCSANTSPAKSITSPIM